MARRTVEFDSLPEHLRSVTFGAQIAARLEIDAMATSTEYSDRASDPIAQAQADAYRLAAEEIRKWHTDVRP